MSVAFSKIPPIPGDRRLSEFAAAVLEGLSSSPRTLPCRFFYDARGSELFEAITRLPEYYLTRAETAILEGGAGDLLASVEPGATLIEFGSGSSRKTELLLGSGRFAVYTPIDVSSTALADAAARLRRRFPALAITPLVADFTGDLRLTGARGTAPAVGFFPGSTIGNFSPGDARALLRRMAALLGPDGRLVIGVDLRKDRKRLIAAYDDAAGVTAAFNLNLLARMRRDLGARVDLDAFAHRTRYNEALGRIEMHLVSLAPQRIDVAGQSFAFAAGETIHTESSYKHTPEGFAALAAAAGWRTRRILTDDEKLFAVMLLETD